LTDPSVDGRITKKLDLGNVRYKGLAWINLAYDRVQWWAAMHMVTNLRALYRGEERKLLDQISDYQLPKTEFSPWNYLCSCLVTSCTGILQGGLQNSH
jgi:hypothetical protein